MVLKMNLEIIMLIYFVVAFLLAVIIHYISTIIRYKKYLKRIKKIRLDYDLTENYKRHYENINEKISHNIPEKYKKKSLKFKK